MTFDELENVLMPLNVFVADLRLTIAVSVYAVEQSLVELSNAVCVVVIPVNELSVFENVFIPLKVLLLVSRLT
jgi:hypothetical protein